MKETIAWLLTLQVGLPLLLVGLNAAMPPGSAAGFSLRASAIALGIVYAAFAGLWLFPPWWTPWAILALHVLVSIWTFRRLSTTRHWPVWARIGEAAVGAGTLLVVAALLYPVLAARTSPEVTVDLAPPLRPGTYLVISGGADRAVNTHLATLAGEQFRPYRGQSYAVDLIAIDALGLRAAGIAPADPSRYRIYGMEVLAPCFGEVLMAVDGLPDQIVPQVDRTHLAGNHVLLGCGDVVVLLAHLAAGSIRVAQGQAVAAGDALGLAGNSGNSSEPHLHIHVQRGMPKEAPLSGDPLWFTIDGRFLVRGDIVTFEAEGGGG